MEECRSGWRDHAGSREYRADQVRLAVQSAQDGKKRAITLPAFAIDELRRLKAQQAKDLALLGIRQDGQTLVCGQADGQPLQPRSLTHEFGRLRARIADLPRVRFHDLRHSHATQMLLAGVQCEKRARSYLVH